MLCDSPPPPPPDTNQDLELSFSGSVRQQEEQQRANEPCATCHTLMDPIGFALGGYDSVGKERSHDELGYRVDTRVEIDGVPASGVEDLARWLTGEPRLHRCVVSQTFTFAMGRPPSAEDERHVDYLTQKFIESGSSFPDLVEAIITHPVFRYRGEYREVLP